MENLFLEFMGFMENIAEEEEFLNLVIDLLNDKNLEKDLNDIKVGVNIV